MSGGSLRLNMAEAEVSALKDALCTQQQLLQKLYAELEAEREASATAASETLSMIWRLQEEKAAEKMEANQYKRIAEEKMKHSEESMALFQEIMFQKEMEIAALEFQIQAYKYKLMSMGINELGIGEGKFDGNPFMRQEKVHTGDLGAQVTVTRHKSLPAVEFKDQLCKMGILDREGSEDLSSYLEQIKQLDQRVKALSHSKNVDAIVHSGLVSPPKGLWPINIGYPEELEVSSLCSEVRSTDLVPDPPRGVTRSRLDFEASSCSSSLPECDDSSTQSVEAENRNVVPSMGIHDVFEVPQVSETSKSREQKQNGKKLALEGEAWRGKPDSIPTDAAENCKYQSEWMKKVLQYSHQAGQMSKPKDLVSVIPGDTTSCTFATQTEIQGINERLEHLESERRVVTQQHYSGGVEELRLLKEIHEQLNTIKSEIRDIKSTKRAPEEPSLDSIMEAMFFYSL